MKEMGILTTVFVRSSNGQTTYVPHTRLVSSFIHNFRRSGHQQERIEFSIPPLTPAEKISLLKQKLDLIIENSPADFWGTCEFSGYDITDLATMRIYFNLHYRSNFQDMRAKVERRARFMNRMQDEMRILGLITPVGPTEINVSIKGEL